MLDMTDFNQKLDQLEVGLVENFERVDIPTEHAFAFGFYIRKVTMPAGAIVSTKVHGVRSPFCITKGKCLVKSADIPDVTLEAPYVGITQPGTRRVICILETTEWVTFQPVDSSGLERAVNNFEAELMIPREGFVSYADCLNRQADTSLND